MKMLRNAVYSEKKALEVKETLEVLGLNWYNMKDQIKAIRVAEQQIAPKVSKML